MPFLLQIKCKWTFLLQNIKRILLTAGANTNREIWNKLLQYSQPSLICSSLIRHSHQPTLWSIKTMYKNCVSSVANNLHPLKLAFYRTRRIIIDSRISVFAWSQTLSRNKLSKTKISRSFLITFCRRLYHPYHNRKSFGHKRFA